MKHWQPYIDRQKSEYLATRIPSDFKADLLVVIPCFDEPEIKKTFESLQQCELENLNVLVVTIINSGVLSDEKGIRQNRKTFAEIADFECENRQPQLRFIPFLFENLPRKHAGVGLARKIGMDLGVAYFRDIENSNGIIVSLDADCIVSENFFQQIHNAYRKNDKLVATVQNFHHRAENDNLDLLLAIRQYEKYIRYFRDALRAIGFPYYWHTIGSAFSVSADAYVRVGGMGRQQGGEDFYFLQKIFALGAIANLEDVFVYPLARFSDRIPFGTGPALQKIIDEPDKQMKVYSPEAFDMLKRFFDMKDSFFKEKTFVIEEQLQKLPEPLNQFLKETNVVSAIGDCNRNSATLNAFRKRFFHHFNAFQIIKFLNFAHNQSLSLQPIDKVADKYASAF